MVPYAKDLLARLVYNIAKRFGTYKEKYLLVHSEIAKPIIAKKVRKEVEQFDEQQRFTNETIAEAREKYEAKQEGASSAQTGTSTIMKTRSAEVKKEMPT